MHTLLPLRIFEVRYVCVGGYAASGPLPCGKQLGQWRDFQGEHSRAENGRKQDLSALLVSVQSEDDPVGIRNLADDEIANKETKRARKHPDEDKLQE